MKKTVWLVFFVFLVSFSFSAKIDETSINVIVDSEGNSLIEETYFISFSDQNEYNSFKEKIEENISAEIVKEFVEIIPKLEKKEAVISFEEQGENKIIKTSYLSDSLFLINEKITSTEFSLSEAKFSFLKSDEEIIFPENFSLRFVVPRETKVKEVVPTARVFSNTVEWTGPIITNKLALTFSMDKTPEPIEIKETIIEIEVQKNGFGVVSEKYLFKFKSQEELEFFVENAQKNGSSLLSWNTFDNRIFVHIAENDFDTKNASVEFVEDGLENSFLNIIYENESPIFIEQKEKSGRFVEWVFNSKKLTPMVFGGVIILPENTLLEITLPANAEILQSDMEIKKGKILWEGYKTTSKINVVYLIKENIAPTFNLSAAIQGILSNKETLTVLFVVLVVVGLVLYVKRDSIGGKIENFILKNSKIEEAEKTEIEIEG